MFLLSNRSLCGRRGRQPRKLFTLHLESLETRLAPSATYYVSPSGNDSRDGQSPQTAWRTIARVNAQDVPAGDTVLFEGGATFSGSLETYHGDPARPKTYSSYGNGRATIASGMQQGITAAGQGGFHIRDLNFVGAGADVNRVSGIDLSNLHVWNGPGANFVVENVDVSGYGLFGLSLFSDEVYGISSVQVTFSRFHENGVGISIGNGSTAPLITDLYIGYVEADNNNSSSRPVGGVGIMMSNVQGGVIERSLLHDNGYSSNSPGHAGLLVYDSSYLTVQYNEAYGNTDPGQQDGQGIVFVGVHDSVIQYNYSHDNLNGGIQLTSDDPYQTPSVSNTIRYNVLENNRSNLVIFFKTFFTEIYNNTVYTRPGPNGEFGVPFMIGFWEGTGVWIRNNIFQAAGGLPVIMVDAESLAGERDIQFLGNVYYGTDLYPGLETYIFWGGEGYYRLTDFQNSTGQENFYGIPTGSTDDPQLVNPGGGGTIGDPDALATLTAYQLQENSLLRYYSGLDLRMYLGIDPGFQDFFDNGLPETGNFSVGAHQSPVEGFEAAPPENEGQPEQDQLDADAAATLAWTMHEGKSRWAGPRFFSPVSIS